jgi:hypothetical protein
MAVSGRGAAVTVLTGILVLFAYFIFIKTKAQHIEHKFMVNFNDINISMGSPLCTMDDRLGRIRQRCDALGIGTNTTAEDVADRILRDKFASIYVDESHKIVYCPVTKSASTTFLNLLSDCKEPDDNDRRATGFRRKYGLPALGRDYTKEEIIHRIKHYYKFIVVRHPFDRLISAYNYMFQSNLETVKLMETLNSLSKQYFNETFDKSTNRLKWEQFLYLVAYESHKFDRPHWRTTMSFCNPCFMPYSGVIRLETLSTDIQPVLKRISANNPNCSAITWRGKLRNSTDKLVEVSTLFRDIDPDVLDKLMSRYGVDMNVLGYTWSKQHGAECKKVDQNGRCC